MRTRNTVLEEHLDAWVASRGKKHERGTLIAHLSATLKIHPKGIGRSMVRLVRRQSRTHRERRGRDPYYGADVTAALYDVWTTASEPCGENLHGMIHEYVTVLSRDGLWKHGDEATQKLLAMSEGTVKRRVGAFMRKYHPHKSRGTTHPSSIHALIPVRKDGWDTSPVGTLQIDTVAHCGGSVAGDFVYTVNAVCVQTFWSTRRAQWNKGQEATLASMRFMRDDFPVPIVEWHPDSGSEFINWLCHDWCRDEGVRLTRSRPNQKNDNTFVEERNGHVVRKYLGDVRLDARACVDAVNELYDVLTPYLNHWVTVRRRMPDGKREKKALTPYARMLLRTDVSSEAKEKLRAEHERTNPKVMKDEIDRRLTRVINLQKRYGTSLYVR